MLKLMKLEIYKSMPTSNFIKRLLYTNMGILALLLLITYVSLAEGETTFTNQGEMLMVINQITRIVYIISAAVMLSRLVIEEFRTKTISVLFMYPINRKKLLSAKLLLVVIYTFISIMIANVLIAAVMVVLNQIWPFLEDQLTTKVLVDAFINILVQAVAACGISLIPIYFGMRRYSTPATIVSSIIIAGLLNSTTGNLGTLSDIIAIPLGFAILGTIVAYLSIRNIEHIDVLQ